MKSTKLKEDLSNCMINFDRPVLITELLDDYQLSYEEVHTIVEMYLEQQHNDIKYAKRYVVHGLQEDEHKKEVYKIVDELKLKEWLKKLKNAESSLYSVEVAGGAKAAAPVFKPMRVEECIKATSRWGTRNSTAQGSTESVGKKAEQEDTNFYKIKDIPKDTQKATPKEETAVKKTSPKKEISQSDKNGIDKKASSKKGINNFFAPSTLTPKKMEDAKATSGSIKTTAPKKMQDFFKKQAEKPKCNENLKPTANDSVQLFDEEEDDPVEEESSDEEEKLENLRRDINSSDVEMEEESETNESVSAKRRRILDSDGEEDPPVKQEKLDVKEEAKEEEIVEETYLDEEGFVITKKPKQKATSTTNKSPATKKVPPVTMKASPKEKKSNKDAKASKNPTAKTKQAGIMNFFTKK